MVAREQLNRADHHHTVASRKPWVQGCVEQAHNSVYSYLHHWRSLHGDAFKWAELLPTVAYMHNTSVQTHKTESPMFQRDGRDNRLANADTLATDDVLPEDEYRVRFDPSFGVRLGEEATAMHEEETQQNCYIENSEETETYGNDEQLQPISAYEARQQRALFDNARGVRRNQQRMDEQTTADDVVFHEGDTVLVRVPHRYRTKLDPAHMLGRVREVQSTPVERRYRIATPAGVLDRMHSGVDIARSTDGVTITPGDDEAMASSTAEVSIQHAARVALGYNRVASPRAASAERRTRRPQTEWWRSP